MKFFIAITLFVVVSALPRPEISAPSEDETPPIVFRHWEPTPDFRIRHRPNAGPNDLHILKELLSQLVNSSKAEDSDVEDNDKTPNNILNALKDIYEILNTKGGNDDEANIPIIGKPDDDQVTPINDRLGANKEVETPISGILGANEEAPLDDDSSVDIINLESEVAGSRNGNDVSENERRLVDFMPRPLQLVARSTPEGIAFIESPVGGVDEPDQV